MYKAGLYGLAMNRNESLLYVLYLNQGSWQGGGWSGHGEQNSFIHYLIILTIKAPL